MEQQNWYQSKWLVLTAVVLFPPVGLILLWLLPRPRILVKLAASYGVILLGIVQLFLVYGLRVELDGGGTPSFVTFSDPEDQMETVERHRAAQAQESEAAAIGAESRGSEEPAAGAAPAADAPTPITKAYWTDFRGPGRNGDYTDGPVLTSWPAEGIEPLWRQPVGGGYASFVVANRRAFTIEQRRDKEVVVAYDLDTGRELWIHSWEAHFKETLGGNGPRATPVWDEGRLYAQGATGELHCLDASTGELKWAQNILEDNQAANLDWGVASSPLIVDDRVIVLPGGRQGASVVAYDKLTGETVWKAQNDRQAYTSPMVVELAGRRQLLVVSAERIMGLQVEGGDLLWSYPWVTDLGINATQPIIIDENRVFITAGYDHGSVLLEIQREVEGFRAVRVWENRNMKSQFNSPVFHDGYIYGFDGGIFVCIDPATGERCWKAGRYGHGQVLLVSEHLIVLTERGELVLLRATPESHQELARFQAVSGKTWNIPALSDGILLVRNHREMAAFSLVPATDNHD